MKNEDKKRKSLYMKIWRKAKKQGKKFEYDADTIRKLNELNKNI